MSPYVAPGKLIPDDGIDDSWFVRPPTPGAVTVPGTPGGGGGTVTSPGSINVPGQVPDYAALIQGDPLFRQYRADVGAEGISDAASRARAIRAMLTQFGEVPEGVWDTYGDVDEATRLAAARNPHSVVAQMQQQHADAQSQMRAALAARGLSSSGQRAFEENRLGQALSQGQYQARNELLGTVGQTQSAFVNSERQRAREIAQAMSEAMGRATQSNPATPGGTASIDDTMQGPDGGPVYKGPDGNYYDGNGNPVQAVPRVTATSSGFQFTGDPYAESNYEHLAYPLTKFLAL